MSKRAIAVTVDVERDWHKGVYEDSPVFSMIETAFPKLLSLTNKHRAPCTFFVTGEAARHCSSLIENAVDSGHEIGTHTHPSQHPTIFKGTTINDKSKDLLKDYSFEQQFLMIREDTKTIREILGYNPVSFRAGKLSANHETIRVLCKLRYRTDSSFGVEHFSRKVSLVPLQCLDIHNSLLEAPVATWISYPWNTGLIGRLRFVWRLSKIKMNSLSFPFLVLGMHLSDFADPLLDCESLFNFLDWMLRYFKRRNYSILTISEASDLFMETMEHNPPPSLTEVED